MSDYERPPNEVGPPDTTPEGPDTITLHQPPPSDRRSSDTRRAGRQCGGGRVHAYPNRAAAWRAGFQRGAVDALRCLGRRLPADTWPVIEALADEYTSAGAE